ncbi:expressed unknown protein [Seminavis robusta]|uniref:Uncharacterized protein n=1 Tax=Seminavis robusta TaxID=568900 RepID=A0A9N8E0T6_9STRA|nr:expressed unknown protein [Seminavis robusta]|eukprot:Sro534_g161770.1 n/a (1774) ;mRNA; f:19362-24795
MRWSMAITAWLLVVVTTSITPTAAFSNHVLFARTAKWWTSTFTQLKMSSFQDMVNQMKEKSGDKSTSWIEEARKATAEREAQQNKNIADSERKIPSWIDQSGGQRAPSAQSQSAPQAPSWMSGGPPQAQQHAQNQQHAQPQQQESQPPNNGGGGRPIPKWVQQSGAGQQTQQQAPPAASGPKIPSWIDQSGGQQASSTTPNTPTPPAVGTSPQQAKPAVSVEDRQKQAAQMFAKMQPGGGAGSTPGKKLSSQMTFEEREQAAKSEGSNQAMEMAEKLMAEQKAKDAASAAVAATNNGDKAKEMASAHQQPPAMQDRQQQAANMFEAQNQLTAAAVAATSIPKQKFPSQMTFEEREEAAKMEGSNKAKEMAAKMIAEQKAKQDTAAAIASGTTPPPPSSDIPNLQDRKMQAANMFANAKPSTPAKTMAASTIGGPAMSPQKKFPSQMTFEEREEAAKMEGSNKAKEMAAKMIAEQKAKQEAAAAKAGENPPAGGTVKPAASAAPPSTWPGASSHAGSGTAGSSESGNPPPFTTGGQAASGPPSFPNPTQQAAGSVETGVKTAMPAPALSVPFARAPEQQQQHDQQQQGREDAAKMEGSNQAQELAAKLMAEQKAKESTSTPAVATKPAFPMGAAPVSGFPGAATIEKTTPTAVSASSSAPGLNAASWPPKNPTNDDAGRPAFPGAASATTGSTASGMPKTAPFGGPSMTGSTADNTVKPAAPATAAMPPNAQTSFFKPQQASGPQTNGPPNGAMPMPQSSSPFAGAKAAEPNGSTTMTNGPGASFPGAPKTNGTPAMGAGTANSLPGGPKMNGPPNGAMPQTTGPAFPAVPKANPAAAGAPKINAPANGAMPQPSGPAFPGLPQANAATAAAAGAPKMNEPPNGAMPQPSGPAFPGFPQANAATAAAAGAPKMNGPPNGAMPQPSGPAFPGLPKADPAAAAAGAPKMNGPANGAMPQPSGPAFPGVPKANAATAAAATGAPKMNGPPNGAMPLPSGPAFPGVPKADPAAATGAPKMNGPPNGAMPKPTGLAFPGLPKADPAAAAGAPKMTGPPNGAMPQPSGPAFPGVPKADPAAAAAAGAPKMNGPPNGAIPKPSGPAFLGFPKADPAAAGAPKMTGPPNGAMPQPSGAAFPGVPKADPAAAAGAPKMNGPPNGAMPLPSGPAFPGVPKADPAAAAGAPKMNGPPNGAMPKPTGPAFPGLPKADPAAAAGAPKMSGPPGSTFPGVPKGAAATGSGSAANFNQGTGPVSALPKMNGPPGGAQQQKPPATASFPGIPGAKGSPAAAGFATNSNQGAAKGIPAASGSAMKGLPNQAQMPGSSSSFAGAAKASAAATNSPPQIYPRSKVDGAPSLNEVVPTLGGPSTSAENSGTTAKPWDRSDTQGSPQSTDWDNVNAMGARSSDKTDDGGILGGWFENNKIGQVAYGVVGAAAAAAAAAFVIGFAPERGQQAPITPARTFPAIQESAQVLAPARQQQQPSPQQVQPAQPIPRSQPIQQSQAPQSPVQASTRTEAAIAPPPPSEAAVDQGARPIIQQSADVEDAAERVEWYLDNLRVKFDDLGQQMEKNDLVLQEQSKQQLAEAQAQKKIAEDSLIVIKEDKTRLAAEKGRLDAALDDAKLLYSRLGEQSMIQVLNVEKELKKAEQSLEAAIQMKAEFEASMARSEDEGPFALKDVEQGYSERENQVKSTLSLLEEDSIDQLARVQARLEAAERSLDNVLDGKARVEVEQVELNKDVELLNERYAQLIQRAELRLKVDTAKLNVAEQVLKAVFPPDS